MRNNNLQKKAYLGAIWTVLGFGLSQGLRLGGNIILTRLLLPDVFGLMALSYVFIRGLNLFSDVGIVPSIVRHERGDEPTFLDTAWTIQVIRGMVQCLGCFIIAWPVANFYNEPLLLKIIPLLGVGVALRGCQSTSLATLRRNMELKKITLFEFSTQTAALLMTIVLTFMMRSVWALVIANLLGDLFRCILSHFLIKNYRRKFAWEKEALREFMTFGRWILLSSILTFAAGQTDRLLLGKIFTTEILGIYTIAVTFAELQKAVTLKVNQSVLFPLFSKALIKNSRSALKSKVTAKRSLLLLALIGLVNLLFNFGDVLIYVLYDERYYDAAWMLPILAVGLWPMLLYITVDPILLAVGKPIYGTIANLGKVVYMLIFIPLANQTFGLIGVIAAIALNDIPTYAVNNWGLWREKFSTFGQDLKYSALLVLAILITALIRYQLGFGFSLSGFFS